MRMHPDDPVSHSTARPWPSANRSSHATVGEGQGHNRMPEGVRSHSIATQLTLPAGPEGPFGGVCRVDVYVGRCPEGRCPSRPSRRRSDPQDRGWKESPTVAGFASLTSEEDRVARLAVARSARQTEGTYAPSSVITATIQTEPRSGPSGHSDESVRGPTIPERMAG